MLWEFLRKLYRKYDKQAPMPPKLPTDKHISEELFGWRYEQVEIFVNDVLQVPKALEMFRKIKIKDEENA